MKLYEIAQSRPEIIVMVGLPGSGKDYWIERYIQSNPGKDYHVVSSDAIIEAIAAAQGKTYSEVFDGASKQAMRQMNSEAAQAIADRRNIIWNQTNMASTKRAKILSQLPKDYVKTAVVVTTDPEVHEARLKARAESTGKNIPSNVIKNMRDNYVEPTREEGFDNIIHVDNTK